MAQGVGLSDVELERLRQQLAAGGAPRVRVSGPQFADQPTGTVLAVGTPETDGDDFVTVRVKAGGVTDELQFSPRELAAVNRGAPVTAARRPARAAPRPGGTTAGRRPAAPGEASAAAAKRTAPAKRAAAAEKAAGPEKAAPKPTASRTSKAAASPPAQGGFPGAAPTPARTAGGSSRRRGASLPTVSLTLASAGATWSVSAHRGSRTVVKNAPIPPGVVSAVAALLGLPAIGDAVAAVNDAALREAEARAAALRSELAALEAELDSHRRPEHG